jgi:TatD DNase family protein
MIDTHVNLHHHLYQDDLAEVLQRAKDGEIHGMLSICDRFENRNQILKIVENRDNFWMSVGAHPHEAKDHLNLTPQDLVEFANHNKVIGIGECGLDFHYNLSPHDQQIKVLETHIIASQICQLPLIVHTRLADEIMMKMLEEAMREKAFPLLMHCYTSGEILLRKMLEIGAYISISGIATFKNAQDVRNNLLIIPSDRLLIETDCPYLSPIPKRGTRNEPEFINYLAKFMAEFLKEDLDTFKQRVDNNFYRLFAKAK